MIQNHIFHVYDNCARIDHWVHIFSTLAFNEKCMYMSLNQIYSKIILCPTSRQIQALCLKGVTTTVILWYPFIFFLSLLRWTNFVRCIFTSSYLFFRSKWVEGRTVRRHSRNYNFASRGLSKHPTGYITSHVNLEQGSWVWPLVSL